MMMVVAYEKRPGRCDVFGGIGQLASLRRVQNEKTHALIYFVVIAPSGRPGHKQNLKKRLNTGLQIMPKIRNICTLKLPHSGTEVHFQQNFTQSGVAEDGLSYNTAIKSMQSKGQGCTIS